MRFLEDLLLLLVCFFLFCFKLYPIYYFVFKHGAVVKIVFSYSFCNRKYCRYSNQTGQAHFVKSSRQRLLNKIINIIFFFEFIKRSTKNLFIFIFKKMDLVSLCSTPTIYYLIISFVDFFKQGKFSFDFGSLVVEGLSGT